MIQVFSKQWFVLNQKNLLRFANSWLGRKVLCIDSKERIEAILPNALYFKEGNQIKAEFRGHDKYAKRLYYGLKPLWEVIHAFDLNIANVVQPKWNLGFDTLTAYPSAGAVSPCDGPVNRVGRDETFATIQGGVGNQGGLESAGTDNIAAIRSSTTSNQYSDLRRGFFNFDTSSLTSGATVSAVVFSIYGVFKSTDLGSNSIECVSHTGGTAALPASDFVNIGTTSFASITSASYSVSGYNDFTCNASGISNINKTGISKYATRIGWDLSASFGGTWASLVETRFGATFADNAGLTQDPKLVVTYTTGGGTNYGVALLLNLL